MIKINISEKMIEQHREYYRKNILPCIKKELNNVVSESKKKKEAKEKLLNYCIINWEMIACGTPNELRQVMNYMESEGINEYLKKHNEYSKYLHEKVFGYERFTGINLDFSNYVIETAKEKLGEDKYNSKVSKEVLGIINTYFPYIYQQAEAKIKSVIDENNNMNRKEVEKLLKSIEFPTITLENYIKYNVWENQWNPYKLIYMTGLRTCPYCNRQYITPIFKYNKSKMRADLDHFFAKSLYPYLSMSLYNLIPSCGFCNSSLKKTKEFDINDINPYEDGIDNYMFFDINFNGTATEITLKERENVNDPDIKNTVKNYKEIFQLDAIYQYHKNIAEDLESKIIHYNNSKILAMKERLGDMFGSEKDIKELIVGKLPSQNEILDEPLNKFKRDILKKYKYLE